MRPVWFQWLLAGGPACCPRWADRVKGESAPRVSDCSLALLLCVLAALSTLLQNISFSKMKSYTAADNSIACRRVGKGLELGHAKRGKPCPLVERLSCFRGMVYQEAGHLCNAFCSYCLLLLGLVKNCFIRIRNASEYLGSSRRSDDRLGHPGGSRGGINNAWLILGL
jgi:hypothetical protein